MFCAPAISLLIAIQIINWTAEGHAGTILGMNTNRATPERLTLPDLVMEKSKDGILVTHAKTGTKTTISTLSLQRWVIRQLRANLT